MMAYKEPVGQENLRDPFQRIRKFRPLIPRPNYLYSYPNHNQMNNSLSCLNRLHHHYHDFGSLKGVEESCNKERHTEQQVMVSSRWNPTPEQLTALEELYRCGTRTPSAEQIQHITSQLRRYGKIEGKNVFYWFQNHKARERQKRRRHQLHQLPLSVTTTSHANINNNRLREEVHDVVDNIQPNDKGPEALRIGIEDDEKNGKRTPFMIVTKDCSDHPMQSAAGPRKADMTSTDAWFQFNETSAASALEFHHSNNLCSCKDLFVSGQKNVTWPANISIVQQPSSSFSCPPHYPGDDPPPSLQLLSLSTKLTYSPDQVVSESPESGVDERDDGNGEPTMALTLQLFPFLTPDEDVTNNNADMMKNDTEIISSALDTTGGKIMSCMDSDEFVPYYQFL